jgi:predicted Zn-dependent peptidase
MLLAAAAVRGTETRSQDDLQRAFDGLGASIHADADLNATDFYIDVMRKNLSPAFGLLAEGVLHPSYAEWAVEGYKKDWIQEIEHPEANLDNFARPLYAAAFGADHPLGRSLGNADSLRSVTTAEVRAFHDRFWKPDIAALIFAGDITLKDAVALATDTLGGWTGAAPVVKPIPPPASKHDRIVFVDRKGVTQTMVLQVLPGVPRNHPDYPALALANRVYGGMSGNRIWENIRQQHGIAYYASSTMPTFPGTGLWIVESPVQQDATAQAMREFEKELTAFWTYQANHPGRTGPGPDRHHSLAARGVRNARFRRRNHRLELGPGLAAQRGAGVLRAHRRGHARPGQRRRPQVRSSRSGLLSSSRRPLQDRAPTSQFQMRALPRSEPRNVHEGPPL